MFVAERLPYSLTHSFSPIVQDYLQQNGKLAGFYNYAPTLEGIQQAVQQRQQQDVDRNVLVKILSDQYASLETSDSVKENIELLSDSCTFTICTAHQPNLFTGPLYFFYKILHTIRVADFLNKELPAYKFVPVYYMGCEDADIDELNHFTVQRKKYTWKTAQRGAFGRMKVDAQLSQLISELQKQVGVDTYGSKWTGMLQKHFREGARIQDALFRMLNELFASYGLIVFIPDTADVKRQLIDVFEDDLFNSVAGNIVEASSDALSKHYSLQAHPREINLFYLQAGLRERIEKRDDHFHVVNTEKFFSADEIRKQLHDHPEYFSPNVILRGILQERVLPNVAFIGGGGELAYWLQLKKLFENYRTPFPVLILRNSFMIVEDAQQQLIEKLQLQTSQLFLSEFDLLNMVIEREGKKPVLNGELDAIRSNYEQIAQMAASYDVTLTEHVQALKTKTINHLLELEKKMARAERKKHAATERQIKKLKQLLFPGGLQERTENIAWYYARFGSRFIDELYQNSLALEQAFTILRQTG